ncbi:uncharacterized protein DUF2029 [Alicyclobacillus sacchari]|uniref:Uncharacterized protein DUF2029 n=1 Tax=Alicyclobacillus sacchari TaxID=392010 RepID=A0A4R8LU70_9BACL|nr:glycosyltransferase family 87 protein [Alicyclobacillus sacchari]TDY51303.1 uncharacterized protein DUF2029 [Alicyclobacillus sacchari]GMA56604.1 hypothetical protein GCM10025858_11070 [Alicyclobacillus sacchari]
MKYHFAFHKDALWGIGILALFLYVISTATDEWIGLYHMKYIGYDYGYFYYAFQQVLYHHTSWGFLYNQHNQLRFLHQQGFPNNPNNQYVYPPQFALLFCWLAVIPFWTSVVLWQTASLISCILGVYWLVRTVWGRIRRIHLILLLSAALTLTPFQMDIGVGNVNSILFACFSLSFFFMYRKNNEAMAAVPLALAVLIKVTPLFVFVLLALQKKWTTMKYTILFVAGFTVFSFPLTGLSTTVQYIIHFLQFGQQSMRNGPAPYNQSLLGVLQMFALHSNHPMRPTETIIFSAYVVVVCFMIAVSVLRSTADKWILRMGMTSMMPIVISPLVEQPHMVFTFPALVALLCCLTLNSNHDGLTLHILRVTVILAYIFESLPFTFLLNHVTHHYASLYWIHMPMFASLVILLIALMYMLNLRHPKEQIADKPSFRVVSQVSLDTTKIIHSKTGSAR